MQLTNEGAFAFLLNRDKVEAFMLWLDEQVKKGMLDVQKLQQVGEAVENAWINQYLVDSYKRGVIRARYELQKAGFDVPSIEQTGGVEMSMSTPFHIDRIGLIYIRAYNDLKGITDAMESQLSRILAQGLADGDGPLLIARKLVDTVNGSGGNLGITDSLGRYIPAQRRAEILARTETIRAHHSATIQEYRNWALEGVVVQAEWMTAGDNRVCDKCQALQGKIFTLDEIEGKIPLHPLCRCIALPYKEGMTKTPSPFLK
jgi:SPP1 gp7 family putative phage head morphogenesis protein